MQIHNDIGALAYYRHAVVTIGSFDGVHVAHQRILKKLISVAKEIQGVSVIISFYPHPRTVIDPDFQFHMINTPEERNRLLEQAGVDVLLTLPFTHNFAALSYLDFIHLLIKHIHLHSIVLGYNHNFGNNREGNTQNLMQLSENYHFNVIEVEKQLVDSQAISSTLIRKMMYAGNIAQVNALLGYAYFAEICIQKEIAYNQTFQFTLCHSSKIFPQKGIFNVRMQQYYAKICINESMLTLTFQEEVKDIVVKQKYNIYFI